MKVEEKVDTVEQRKGESEKLFSLACLMPTLVSCGLNRFVE